LKPRTRSRTPASIGSNQSSKRLVKLGHVALDGTKIKANASKHKAMSYERMKKREAELKAEVACMLAAAEAADAQLRRPSGQLGAPRSRRSVARRAHGGAVPAAQYPRHRRRHYQAARAADGRIDSDRPLCAGEAWAPFEHEIQPVRNADGQVDIGSTMQVITHVIEGWIREHPEQWLWLHRRWR
jgi:Bacterial lipid A biosynthesis acyltransferase